MISAERPPLLFYLLLDCSANLTADKLSQLPVKEPRSNSLHPTLFVIACFSLLLTACERGENLRDADTVAFAEAFRKANQADSASEMLALYHLEGVEDRTIRMLEQAIEYELKLPIESIEFLALSGAPEESIDFIHNGMPYGASIEPRIRMRVVYDLEDQFTSLYSLGQLPDRQWRIVCAKPKPSAKLSTVIAPH